MSDDEFYHEIWRHLVAIMKALAARWFSKRITIGGDPP